MKLSYVGSFYIVKNNTIFLKVTATKVLAKYVIDHQKELVMVNPFSVKKIKELDDSSPKKTDSKDQKTIAKLVVDGRYSIPYLPDGIYAEIRDLVYRRDRIVKQHNISANRIQRWLAIHFPEFLGIYTRFDSKSGLAVLEKAPLPKDVIALGGDGIRKIWHDKKICGRGVTEDRAMNDENGHKVEETYFKLLTT